jgi:hypothetical protein
VTFAGEVSLDGEAMARRRSPTGLAGFGRESLAGELGDDIGRPAAFA